MKATGSPRAAGSLRSVLSDNRAALLEAEIRRRRLWAIERAGHQCDQCGFFAWSHAREDELRIVTREMRADRVLCAKCAELHDAKEAKRKILTPKQD